MARRLRVGTAGPGRSTPVTNDDADVRAAALGLSAWVTQAIAVGPKSRVIDLYCVGFASIDLPLAEAESWDETFAILSELVL
jgi:hypothetical protein